MLDVIITIMMMIRQKTVVISYCHLRGKEGQEMEKNKEKTVQLKYFS